MWSRREWREQSERARPFKLLVSLKEITPTGIYEPTGDRSLSADHCSGNRGGWFCHISAWSRVALVKEVFSAQTRIDKNTTYECGLESKDDALIQFRPEYYLYAIIFLIFDVEAVFLLPFAVAFTG